MKPSPAQSSEQRRTAGSSLVARAVFFVFVLCVLASGLYFASRSGSNAGVYSNDFNVYYYASREIVAGRDPYEHSLGAWTPYLYPPLLAELLVPLALLPLPLAAYLWFLINAVSVIAAAWLSVSLASDQDKRDTVLSRRIAETASSRMVLAACSVAIVFRFVLDTLDLGQVNAVVAALAVAHLYLYARDRKALSAVALVFAISIKLTPAVLIVYHIAKFRLRFALTCGALLVALTVMSFVPFGASGLNAFNSFVNRTIRNEQGYDFAYAGNQSLRGAVARLIVGNEGSLSDPNENRRPSDSVTVLASIALLAIATFAAVRAQGELAGAAAFVCCMVLLSPLSWKAHFIVLILPLSYVLSRMRSATGAERLLIGASLIASFALFNLTSPRIIGLTAAEWADGQSLVFAGALLIFFCCAATAIRRKFGKQAGVC
ncbi:MAG: glycosyltransferase family 87 protein [Blastocatellia bacterium]